MSDDSQKPEPKRVRIDLTLPADMVVHGISGHLGADGVIRGGVLGYMPPDDAEIQPAPLLAIVPEPLQKFYRALDAYVRARGGHTLRSQERACAAANLARELEMLVGAVLNVDGQEKRARLAASLLELEDER